MRRASQAVLKPRRGRRRSEQRWTMKLLSASEEGDADRVATCLLNGASITTSGPHGTALHCACREGHTGVVQILLDHDAPVDVLADTDFTPLHLATQRGHVELVNALISAGANTDMPSRFERRSAAILATLDGWERVLSVLLTGNPVYTVIFK